MIAHWCHEFLKLSGEAHRNFGSNTLSSQVMKALSFFMFSLSRSQHGPLVVRALLVLDLVLNCKRST